MHWNCGEYCNKKILAILRGTQHKNLPKIEIYFSIFVIRFFALFPVGRKVIFLSHFDFDGVACLQQQTKENFLRERRLHLIQKRMRIRDFH